VRLLRLNDLRKFYVEHFGIKELVWHRTENGDFINLISGEVKKADDFPVKNDTWQTITNTMTTCDRCKTEFKRFIAIQGVKDGFVAYASPGPGAMSNSRKGEEDSVPSDLCPKCWAEVLSADPKPLNIY